MMVIDKKAASSFLTKPFLTDYVMQQNMSIESLT
jgi:hypothetical protein